MCLNWGFDNHILQGFFFNKAQTLYCERYKFRKTVMTALQADRELVKAILIAKCGVIYIYN